MQGQWPVTAHSSMFADLPTMVRKVKLVLTPGCARKTLRLPLPRQRAGGPMPSKEMKKRFPSQITVRHGQLRLIKITVDLDKRHNAKNVQVLT